MSYVEYDYKQEKEIIEEVKKGTLYDYMANHYTEISKDMLARLVMELDYEMSHYSKAEYKNSLEHIAEELEDYWVN